MQKFLVLLGMPRCATSWLNSQIIAQPGVNVMPRKEINYFMRQYGSANRLSDTIRFKQFQAYAAAQKLGLKKGSKDVVREKGGRLEEPGMLAAADPDPQGLWGKGGNYRKSHKKLKAGLQWYMKYVNGPVNDDWYRALHDAAGEDEWCVDFSTSNGLVSDDGFKAMAQFAPTVKSILILRHPLDRLASHLRLVAEKSGEDAKEPLKSWSEAKVRSFIDERDLLKRSLYGPVVGGMKNHFAPENQMIIDYEDIAADPKGIVSNISDFLGVDARQRVLDKLEPREGFAKGTRKKHPQLASYVAPCLESLKDASKAGVDLVDPWIADLESY